MKKYLLAALALGAIAISGSAQNPVVNNPANKGYFGVRVAADITCPGKITYEHVGVDAYKNGGGIEFGGIYNAPIVANLFIEPGLKFYYDTYSAKKDLLESNSQSLTMKKFGMRIPVMVGYHFDFTSDTKVSIFTGPELEIGFSAKECLKENSVSISESVYGEDGGMNRADLSWAFGAGVTFNKFYIGVSGTVGMLNMLKDGDGMKFHENRAAITLGYNF